MNTASDATLQLLKRAAITLYDNCGCAKELNDGVCPHGYDPKTCTMDPVDCWMKAMCGCAYTEAQPVAKD